MQTSKQSAIPFKGNEILNLSTIGWNGSKMFSWRGGKKLAKINQYVHPYYGTVYNQFRSEDGFIIDLEIGTLTLSF